MSSEDRIIFFCTLIMVAFDDLLKLEIVNQVIAKPAGGSSSRA